MRLRYFATFPESAGQYAGTHWFRNPAERFRFLTFAAFRGYDPTEAVVGKV